MTVPATRFGQMDERVLVLAPRGHDAAVAAEVLTQAGFSAVRVPDVARLCEQAQVGAAALLLAEEALDSAGLETLSACLEAQEPWSDLPVLLLTGQGRAAAGPLETFAALGNVTLLERPLEIVTLVSATRAAVRARRRQYGARATLLELETVLDTVPAAVFTARDGAARISGNRHASELFGVPADANFSSRGAPAQAPQRYQLLHEGLEIPLDQIPIERAIATGREVRNAEVDLVTATGQRRHLLGSAAPLRERQGHVTGAVAAFLDITEQHRAAETLRDSDRRKTEFLAVLSHELRNPLAAIVNAAHLLGLVASGGEQARRAREVIERQSGQLARLVDDLLDLTRIERGKVALQPRRIDLAETARRTCEDHQQILEERGVSLEVRTPEEVWIDADPTRVAQMIGNLLQNAARFGRRGGTVVVETARVPGSVELRVRDDGVGIAPELLPRLFTPFVQSEDSRSRRHGGLGLGLSLVKGLVELHGGRVRAHSDGPGRGAEFVLTLPAQDRPPVPTPVQVRAQQEAKGRVHLLIIEDNVDAARMLADVLEVEGYRVDLAHDAGTGLAMARRRLPDVVLCDIGLPDMDGYALAQTLRSDPRLAHTRLIALSGYAQHGDRERSEQAGFDAHLAKPADLDELERLLAVTGPRVARAR